MPSVQWHTELDLFPAHALEVALERRRTRTPRCQGWSHGHFPCFGKAYYVVSATPPRETEPPMVCRTHAKMLAGQVGGHQGVIYRQAPQGHGWVVV